MSSFPTILKREIQSTASRNRHAATHSWTKDVAALILTFTETRRDTPALFCVSSLLKRAANCSALGCLLFQRKEVVTECMFTLKQLYWMWCLFEIIFISVILYFFFPIFEMIEKANDVKGHFWYATVQWCRLESNCIVTRFRKIK